jgi:hypothetical protein
VGKSASNDILLTMAAALSAKLGDCWVCAEVGATVATVLLESALRPPRRYLSGEGFAGESSMESDRSGVEEDSVRGRIGAVSVIDFLTSPTAKSSFEPNAGATKDRLEDPDVDTVESDEEDACDGCPSFAEWFG